MATRTDPVMALLARLNTRDRQFLAATPEVVGGFDLESSSNRHYGKNVYVANLGPANVKVRSLVTGVVLRVGAVEKLPHGRELRCRRDGDLVTVAVYDKQGDAITRVLGCSDAAASSIDEGWFTWFGPVEDYGTPWSDSGPAYCQVVTVDALRKFAREKK